MTPAKKIVWTANGILPELAAQYGRRVPEKGHWLTELHHFIMELFGDRIELHIITFSKGITKEKEVDFSGTRYHILPLRKRNYLFGSGKELNLLIDKIKRINPSFVHVHGTEDIYGMITGKVKCPVIISLQGVRKEIKKFYFSDVSRGAYFKMMIKYRNFDLLKNLLIWHKKTRQEEEIIRKNRYFIGRTLFDKACCTFINPGAEYITGEDHRIVRKEFYLSSWDLTKTEKYSIHTTLSESTFKGIFLIIRAIEFLRTKYPDIRINIAGSLKGPIGKSAVELIKKKNMVKHFHFLGSCSGKQLADSMLKSRVFVMGSYIDNSPNALQEAQVLGMPVIAAFTGGIPSLVDDRVNGLLYPRGDLYYLTQLISEVFENDSLAVSLGENARKLKDSRNNPEKLKELYRDIYSRFLNGSNDE